MADLSSNQQLRDWLFRYGMHSRGCNNAPCNCGWEQVSEQLVLTERSAVETTGDGVWIHVREGMTLGEIGRLIDAENEKRRALKTSDDTPFRDKATTEYRKWPGEPPHCMTCSCGMLTSELGEPALIEELLAQCEMYHQALDIMFARMMLEQSSKPQSEHFFPSKSGQPWEACTKGHALIQRIRAAQKKHG